MSFVCVKGASTGCQSSPSHCLSLPNRLSSFGGGGVGVGVGMGHGGTLRKAALEEAIVCLSQRLELDLIFDTEHVAFECKSVLIVSASDRVKRSL